jgi:hypothetical protein
MLGKSHETNIETTAAARQQTASNNGSTVGDDIFYVVHSKAISCNQPSSVQLLSAVQGNEKLVGELMS